MPGVVLAVAPNGNQVLINDQVRSVLYIYNASGSVARELYGYGEFGRLDSRLKDALHH